MHHSNLQKRRHLLCIGSYQKIFKRENHKSVPDHLLGVLLREYSKACPNTWDPVCAMI